MTSQPRVRDLTTPRVTAPPVETALHGAADLLVALWLVEGCDEMTQSFDEYGLGVDWFAGFVEALSPETRSLLSQIGSGNVWISAMSILDDMANGSTVEDFIKHVDGMDPTDLRLALLAMHETDSADYERLALVGLSIGSAGLGPHTLPPAVSVVLQLTTVTRPTNTLVFAAHPRPSAIGR